MIRLPGRVCNGGKNIIPLKEWIISEDLLERRVGGQKLQNISDPQTLAADAGVAATFSGFDGDSRQQIALHKL